MTNQNPVHQAQYWDDRYHAGNTGWDLRGPHPFLPTVVSHLPDLKNQSVLVVGAGPGHDLAYLAERSLEATGVDFAPHARDYFSRYYPQCTAPYLIADVLQGHESLPTVDVVFEHTLLCAIRPQDHGAYFDAVNHLVKPQGYWAALLWTQTGVEQGPPFSTPLAPVLQHLKDRGFAVHVERPVVHGPAQRNDKEIFILAKRSVRAHT